MKLAGLWAPILTPLRDDGDIDHARLRDHARRVRDDGCDGVVLFGTTGEAPSFSVAERRAALEALLGGGFPPDRLIVGTGCAALTDTLDLAGHARDSGVLAVLVLPPFYYKSPLRAGIERYFDRVLEALAGAATRALLYNFPRLAGIVIDPELAQGLAARHGPALAGAKDSSGDPASTRALCRALPGGAIFPGTEAILVDALDAGAAGLISATANLNAAGLRAALQAWRAGNREEAVRLQAAAVAFRAPFELAGMIPSLKAALAERLGDPAWRRVRPPWVEAAPR
jgi:4-hydroxy-tetrahydrodipicolinate synthase